MKQESKVLIGVIADDFTGASDAASFLVKAGLDTILYTKLPEEIPDTCECIVIALKSRSVLPHEAIHQIEEALSCLKKLRAKRIYFKYCSTFDSTPQGNIGITLDYLMNELNQTYTILCPSLPVNGRTVKNGYLYVNGVELSKSSMRNHPLNPMWDSYIPNLMKGQSSYPCFVVSREDIEENRVHTLIQEYKNKYERFYIVPDYESDSDARLISKAFQDICLLSGGSGLLEHLHCKKEVSNHKTVEQEIQKAIILCGSCSSMSEKQIQRYRIKGGITYAVDSKKLLNGEIAAQEIFDYISNQKGTVLVYSDAIEKDINELSQSDSYQLESKLVEKLMSDISVLANSANYSKIIVAGGETSGSVTIALGYCSYYTGEMIAPGVPILIPLENMKMKLILKSGNFGDEDFFEKALER